MKKVQIDVAKKNNCERKQVGQIWNQFLELPLPNGELRVCRGRLSWNWCAVIPDIKPAEAKISGHYLQFVTPLRQNSLGICAKRWRLEKNHTWLENRKLLSIEPDRSWKE